MPYMLDLNCLPSISWTCVLRPSPTGPRILKARSYYKASQMISLSHSLIETRNMGISYKFNLLKSIIFIIFFEILIN